MFHFLKGIFYSTSSFRYMSNLYVPYPVSGAKKYEVERKNMKWSQGDNYV